MPLAQVDPGGQVTSVQASLARHAPFSQCDAPGQTTCLHEPWTQSPASQLEPKGPVLPRAGAASQAAALAARAGATDDAEAGRLEARAVRADLTALAPDAGARIFFGTHALRTDGRSRAIDAHARRLD